MVIVIDNESFNYSVKVQRDSKGKERKYFRSSVLVSSSPNLKKVLCAPSVELLRKKILDTLHSRSLSEASLLSFSRYLDLFLENNALNLKASTFSSYEYCINSYVKPYLGDYKMASLSEAILRSYFEMLLSSFGSNTANKVRIVLSRPLREACEKSLTYGNIISYIKLPKVQRAFIETLSQKECSSLLELCRNCDDSYSSAIALSLLLGLRISEAIGIEITSVNLDKRFVVIRRQIIKNRGSFIVQDSTKNNCARSLYLSDLALFFVKRELDRQSSYLGKGTFNNVYSCLFTDSRGSHLRHDALRRHLKCFSIKINRPNLKFHHLRHTAASIVHEVTGNVHLTKDLLGHKRYDSTGLYIHSSFDKLKEASCAIASFVSTKEVF